MTLPGTVAGAVIADIAPDRKGGSRWDCYATAAATGRDALPHAREDVLDRRRLLDRDRRRPRAFKVDGKALRVRETLVLEDPSGAELYKIQEKKLSDPRQDGDRARRQDVATVKKALVTPLRDRYSIDVEDGEDMEAKGNIVDHEYKIERDGDKVAEVSKRWFRVRDTYGIEVAEGQDDALILAITVCIDQMGIGD